MVRKSTFHFLLAIILLGFAYSVKSQSTIYSENFNNGCASNCLATTWNGWTVVNNVGGSNGSSPNRWFVSCAEDGVAPPGCGAGCAGDASLHIGSDPGGGGDMGASFNETAPSNATHKLVVSPTISTAGFSFNTLAFDFIAFGSAACANDRAQLRLSTDNGATWPVGFQYCLTSPCCGGACSGYLQGQWTTYTLALPAAFDNNPNVRVGFHWRNNGDGAGTDPSIAVDDVRITTIPLPVRLISFTAREENKGVKLNWTTADEAQLARYEIQKGDSPEKLVKISSVAAKGSPSNEYSFRDPALGAATAYYRLKMVDENGTSQFSNILRVVPGENNLLDLQSVSPSAQGNNLNVSLWAQANFPVDFEIRDLQGRLIKQLPPLNLLAGENNFNLDITGTASATYLLIVKARPSEMAAARISRKFVLTR